MGFILLLLFSWFQKLSILGYYIVKSFSAGNQRAESLTLVGNRKINIGFAAQILHIIATEILHNRRNNRINNLTDVEEPVAFLFSFVRIAVILIWHISPMVIHMGTCVHSKNTSIMKHKKLAINICCTNVFPIRIYRAILLLVGTI